MNNYKQKYLAYKSKYIALKNQLGGARTYEQMPENITITDYVRLHADEQIFYDVNNFKIDRTPLGFEVKYCPKLSKEVVDRIVATKAAASVREAERKRLRNIEIRDTPGIRITVAEYKALPADKYGFEWIAQEDQSFYHEIDAYVKGRSLAEIRAQELALERERSQIITKPRITYLEYGKLNFAQSRLYRPVDGLNALELRREMHDYVKK